MYSLEISVSTWVCSNSLFLDGLSGVSSNHDPSARYFLRLFFRAVSEPQQDQVQSSEFPCHTPYFHTLPHYQHLIHRSVVGCVAICIQELKLLSVDPESVGSLVETENKMYFSTAVMFLLLVISVLKRLFDI